MVRLHESCCQIVHVNAKPLSAQTSLHQSSCGKLHSFTSLSHLVEVDLLDAFSSEKLLYMPNVPMVNKRVTRKCIDAARQNAILESRKRVGTKEMVLDSDAQGVYIGGWGMYK